MPAEMLPVQIGRLSEHDDAYLTMLHESTLPADSRAAIRQGRLSVMFEGDTAGSDRYYLLGFLSASDGASLDDGDSLLLACSRDDGALYLEHPETGRGLFYGYFEKLERILLQGKEVTRT